MRRQDCTLLAENVGRFHAKFWDHELLKHQVTHRPSPPLLCRRLGALLFRSLRLRQPLRNRTDEAGVPQVVCGGEPTKCNVWFETWTRAVAANPSFADIVNKALNPEGGNKNLPLSGGSIDLYPNDGMKKMLALWKAHGNALADEFHKTLDSRPFTLTHGDLRADNLFRKGSNGSATGFKFIDWQTYACAPPGCDMTQMLAGSMQEKEMDVLPEILQKYLDTLHANCEAARDYTLQARLCLPPPPNCAQIAADVVVLADDGRC